MKVRNVILLLDNDNLVTQFIYGMDVKEDKIISDLKKYFHSFYDEGDPEDCDAIKKIDGMSTTQSLIVGFDELLNITVEITEKTIIV